MVFPRIFLLFATCLFVLTSAAPADDIRRITLDGKAVAPDATDLLIPGQPNPEHRPLTPVLELFPTYTKQPSHGTILLSPGGGYAHLSVVHEGLNVAKLLNGAGWDVAVLLYHVDAGPDTRALALADAQKAYALLQTRGGEFGLSTARIGAMGFSAGGHLTARLAHETAAAGKAPAFLVLAYPAYLEKDGVLLADVSPVNVPTFLCVGDQDHTYLPSSVAYEAACKAKGIPCTYTVAAGAGHGFGITDKLPAGARDWPDRLTAFLAALPK